MKAIVIQEHKSNYPDPITFTQGDQLLLAEVDTEFDGWIRVTTDDNNQGWAPIQYIDFVQGSNVGTAKCDYCARELDTQLDESLNIVLQLNGWYLVTRGAGESGWVPVTTVQLVSS